ncbi:MAG: hypothetical protein J6W35_04370, partial [Eubacterium sp.]|nr:hypothetical protein [Eubacterium sp.]
MKSLKRLLVAVIALTFVFASAKVDVKAASDTDLKTMQVYSVDTAGAKKELKFNFKPTTYKYDFIVKSNCVRIEILVTTKNPTSTAVVDKEAVNTRMDTGKNKTTVTVTAPSGAKQVYKLNTKKLTPAEDSKYKEGGKAAKASSSSKKKVSKKSAKVEMNGKEYKITSFSKKDIPRGFVKTTASYNGKKYDAIKGKEKDLTAFYLNGPDGEGFCIYDKDAGKFYIMNNVKVKSRMYTIVEPEKTDDILKNYDKKTIKIDGQKVKAWILDDEKEMFFVYAMNWDGETSLYVYDDIEKCMQRYLIDNDVNSQIEAANQAYDNMKARKNELTKKYNIFRYVIIGMAVLIIILIFLLIHSKLNKKEKKIKAEEFVTAGMGEEKPDKKDKKSKKEEKEETEEQPDEDDIDAVPVGVPETEEDGMDEVETEDDILDLDLDEDEDAVPDENIEVDADEIEIEPAEDFIDNKVEDTPVVETPVVDTPVEEPVEETHKKKRDFSKRHDGYGDEPTFGTD